MSVSVCVQEFKLFHYLAQLIPLQCVSSFKFDYLPHSPSPPLQSFSPPSLLFHSLVFYFLSNVSHGHLKKTQGGPCSGSVCVCVWNT